MLRSIKFWGVASGAGVLIGVGLVGWIYMHRSDTSAAVEPPIASMDSSLNSARTLATVPLSDNTTSTPSPTPGLRVSSTGSQGEVAGDSTQSTSATPTSNISELPGPNDFSQYDKYIFSSTALYEDIKVGVGNAVAQGSVVAVQYQGWLTNGTEFDSTSSTGAPFSFTEGANTVISGWEQAIFGMKVGGERRLIIPPSVGYGAVVHGPIPANSVLVFDITLVSVQ